MSQLDQEEALALVLAHLRGYALLPDEARNIGELARLAAIAYKGKPPGAKGKAPKKKPADQVLKDNASTAKSQARAAAAKDATLAAGLMERLEGIDAVAATNRRQLARAPVSLPWPPRATVITSRAAPRPKPPTSELARLRKAAVVAAEQVKAAECDYAASKRVAERAKHVVDKYVALQREMLSQLCPRKLLDSNGQIKEPEVCEHDYEACAAATERARALYDEVRAGRDEDEDALLVARAAAEEASDAVAAEERAQAQRAQWEREYAERAEQRAQAEAACAVSRAEVEVAKATQARIRLLERELAALKCEETREWLAAEEARANWQTPPAECKVISLMESSPAQMRSLAAERGVAEVDRSRILISRLGEPDVMAPEV